MLASVDFNTEEGIKRMGKNFSRNNGKRDKIDFFQTPYCLTQAFVDRHIKIYWEPDREEHTICDYCSGAGAIVKVLNDSGFRVLSGDIRDPQKLTFSISGKGMNTD